MTELEEVVEAIERRGGPHSLQPSDLDAFRTAVACHMGMQQGHR